MIGLDTWLGPVKGVEYKYDEMEQKLKNELLPAYRSFFYHIHGFPKLRLNELGSKSRSPNDTYSTVNSIPDILVKANVVWLSTPVV